MKIPMADGLGEAIAQPTNLSRAGSNPAAFGQGLADVALEYGQRQQQVEHAARLKVEKEEDEQALYETRRKLDDWERGAIWDPQKGAVARQGRDAFELPKTLPGEFDQAAAEITSATSPRIKQAAQQMVLARRERVTQWVDGHALKERERFGEQQYQADRQNFLDNAALYASDPVRAQTEIAMMGSRTVGYLRSKGASDEVIQASVKDNTSRMHSAVLGSLINSGDVVKAQKYLNENAGGMNADEYLKAQNIIKGEVDARTGLRRAAVAVESAATTLAPTDTQRLLNLQMQAESGGRRYAPDGSLLQGPSTRYGTAKGEMQVLDGTNLDPGFGVRGADPEIMKNGTPEQKAAERARVGRDYSVAMIKRYDGDIAKGLAAYNWGPGNVDQAIVRAGARPGGDWMTFAPAETQNYVAKITKAYTAGQGAPQARTLDDVLGALQRDPELANSPRAMKTAVSDATARWAVKEKAVKEHEDAAVATALRGLIANGGSWAGLSPSVRNAVPPGKVDEMLNFGDRLVKGQQSTDWGLYGKLMRDPDVLRSTNLMAFRDRFAEAEFKQLTERQATVLKPGPEHRTQIESARGVIDGFMRQAGIDPTLSDKSSKADAEKVGRILSAYEDRIAAAEAPGKKLTVKELREIAAPLFAQEEIYGRVWNSKKPSVLVDKGDEVVVPDAERSKIVAALRRAGRPVSSEAVMTIYRKSRSMPGGE